MRAIVHRAYGEPESVLSLQDIPVPVIKPDEVLVRVRAASVHPDVWHVVTGRPYVLRLMGAGLSKPKRPVPGIDLAGVVESAGAAVTGFRKGDAVFGETVTMQWTNGGTYAEYAAVRAEYLALKPANVSFEQAAAVPVSGYIAYTVVYHQGKVGPGRKVLINGAAGGVGLVALQLARALGAKVTGVDAPAKLDLMRKAGADHVIDYTAADFTEGSERYDLVVDIPGNQRYSRIRRVLGPAGLYILIGHDGYGRTAGKWLGSIPRVFRLIARTPFDRHMPRRPFSTPPKKAAMAMLRDLIEQGKITPAVGATFPLAEAAKAIRHLADGGAVGKVVLTM
jgi:NADPH:quinone reductase-like Zn-dependent oxidoreductase